MTDRNGTALKIGDWIQSESFFVTPQIGQIIGFFDTRCEFPIAIRFCHAGQLKCKDDELIKISEEEAMLYLLES